MEKEKKKKKREGNACAEYDWVVFSGLISVVVIVAGGS